MMLSKRDTNVSRRATDVATACRETARIFVGHHGRQRGLHALARAVGITERRARSLHDGTAARIDAAEYLAVLDARIAIAQQHAARLAHELEILHAMGQAGAVVDAPGGMAAAPGAVVPASRMAAE